MLKLEIRKSTEDYLKVIYNLSLASSGYVKTMAISEALQISAPAVSEMVRKLSEKGYVVHIPYKGVKLTRLGLNTGKNMVRRHRILEAYLFDIGFPQEKLHDEAEKLEHAASDELIDLMEKVLNYPKVDPHGSLIPGPTKKRSTSPPTPPSIIV